MVVSTRLPAARYAPYSLSIKRGNIIVRGKSARCCTEKRDGSRMHTWAYARDLLDKPCLCATCGKEKNAAILHPSLRSRYKIRPTYSCINYGAGAVVHLVTNVPARRRNRASIRAGSILTYIFLVVPAPGRARVMTKAITETSATY